MNLFIRGYRELTTLGFKFGNLCILHFSRESFQNLARKSVLWLFQQAENLKHINKKQLCSDVIAGRNVHRREIWFNAFLYLNSVSERCGTGRHVTGPVPTRSGGWRCWTRSLLAGRIYLARGWRTSTGIELSCLSSCWLGGGALLWENENATKWGTRRA